MFDSEITDFPPLIDMPSSVKINDVLLSNDVFLVGYPISLGSSEAIQYNKALPLLRKGIVAGVDKEKRTIVLDCSVYPGNNGAPVYQRNGIVDNEFGIIGVVSQFIPYVQEWINKRDKLRNIEYQNSGYSVITSMDGVNQLIDDNMDLFK